jgi:putative transcriptional regulator
MKAFALNTGGAAKAEVLRIKPGHGAPMHAHRGSEVTLVLQGAYQDGHRRYGRGDLSIAGPDVRHRPIAEAGEVCYALTVIEDGLVFEGALGALQKLLGR